MKLKKIFLKSFSLSLSFLLVFGFAFSSNSCYYTDLEATEQLNKPVILETEENEVVNPEFFGEAVLSFIFQNVGKTILKTVLNLITDTAMAIVKARGWFDPDVWSVMSTYTVNLNEEVKKGNILPSIGREAEYSQLCNYISDDDKGHVILVGDSGVGKTQLIEGLAYKIQNGEFINPDIPFDSPENLGKLPLEFKNKQIIRVNMVDLIAGKSYNNGEGAVNRIRALFDKARKNSKYILFIDEVHQIVQAGAAELFKTYLDDNKLKLITATTTKEYEYIEKDDALARRFVKIPLNTPTQFDTLQILRGMVEKIETRNNVEIEESALLATIKLTDRYMQKRSFPSKAVDVLRSAAKMVSSKKKTKVTENDIRAIISVETGIPITILTEKEMNELIDMEKHFQQYLAGQDEVIKATCDEFRKWRTGISDSNKPIASFLFCGTAGVGKRWISELWGDKIGNLIKINMSKYNTPVAVAELVGSKFYNCRGELTEQVWERPYSAILFEDIDKADKGALNVISGMLKNGYIADYSNKKIDFRNTMIFMTSSTSGSLEEVREKMAKKLGFEFLNKIDRLIVFNQLSEKQNKKITEIALSFLKNRLSDSMNISLDVDENVIEKLSKTSFDVKFGARKIQNIIKDEFETPISQMYLKGELKQGQIIDCSLDENENIVFEICE